MKKAALLGAAIGLILSHIQAAWRDQAAYSPCNSKQYCEPRSKP